MTTYVHAIWCTRMHVCAFVCVHVFVYARMCAHVCSCVISKIKHPFQEFC